MLRSNNTDSSRKQLLASTKLPRPLAGHSSTRLTYFGESCLLIGIQRGGS
jgi:hypothetical protein